GGEPKQTSPAVLDDRRESSSDSNMCSIIGHERPPLDRMREVAPPRSGHLAGREGRTDGGLLHRPSSPAGSAHVGEPPRGDPGTRSGEEQEPSDQQELPWQAT